MTVYIKDPIEVYEDDVVIGETKPFQKAYIETYDNECTSVIIDGGEFDGYDFYWYFKNDKPEELLTEKELEGMKSEEIPLYPFNLPNDRNISDAFYYLKSKGVTPEIYEKLWELWK